MNVAMSVGLVLAAILGACLLVLWYGSATVIDKHEDRITGLEKRWTETFGGPEPAVDDEPAALAGDDCPTDETPVAPPTVPDGMPLVVQSVLIERRPSPMPRGKSAEWVEAELSRFNFTGRDR